MIELHSPNLDFVESYLDFVAEMHAHGEKVWEEWIPMPGETPSEFVDRFRRAETHLPDGRVPESTYWAVMDEQVVGRISLRHSLNRNLEEFGGHIGYEVSNYYWIDVRSSRTPDVH